MFTNADIRWITSLDAPGGIVDQYIESLQLHRRDLSFWVKRTSDIAGNIKRFCAAWKERDFNGECCAFISVWDFSDAQNMDFSAVDIPPGVNVVIVTAHYRKIDHPQVFAIGAATNSLDEFNAKVGSHIARFVRLQPEGSPFHQYKPTYTFPQTYGGSHLTWNPVIDTAQEVRLDMHGHRLDILSMLRKGSSGLLVIEQSAVGRGPDRNPPFFQRWTWAEDFHGGSVLVLNDPALHENSSLEAGWWFGTREHDYIHELVLVIKRILAALALDPEDVIFYGGSAGGFSALSMAAALPGSLAVSDIPQINMRTYHAKIAADAAARTAFEVPDIESVPATLLHRIDVVERFKFEHHVPRFLLLQNILDYHHIGLQYSYLISHLSELQLREPWSRSPYEVQAYKAWNLRKGGHFPLNRQDTMEIINSYAERTRPLTPDAS